jgi:hypothetical protein
MPSIIEGYNYDIFISYRQKDNKYDGWVTEFVDNLKKELEATFKEEISVYFDINPHDGLLETHDVDASLKDKLKCLVFIPIISRTYCDPKSFAWEHEFKAFVEQTSHDQLGLKVRLPNGNVAGRVLPIRIHDLDIADIKLCETVLGGVLRGIEFIYKESGVNRPLRSNEDNPHDNLNHTIYRNQINKVALAIKEIIRSIQVLASASKSGDKNDQIKETAEGKGIITEEPSKKIKIKQVPKLQVEKNPKAWRGKIFRYLPIILIVAIILIAGIAVTRLIYAQKKQYDARDVIIPEIQKLVEENFTPPFRAFELATEAEKYIPGNSALINLWPRVAENISLQTQPEGAMVFWKEYDQPSMPWEEIGKTQFKDAKVPLGYKRYKIEKEGFQTIILTNFALASFNNFLKLDSTGLLPQNMVRIPAQSKPMYLIGLEKYLDGYNMKRVGEFLVDRFEVTNKEYKQFIDANGYDNKNFWKYPIYSEGKEITWESAMKIFIDKTGKQGPANWEAGTYPDGEEDFPVVGISWYEASAFASFSGEKLPTVYHWNIIAEIFLSTYIVPLSNFNLKSTVKTGTTEGMCSYGIYDLAGNVREWCDNQNGVKEEAFILGGGWNDASYSFSDAISQPFADRSLSNGFRCIIDLSEDSTSRHLSDPVSMDVRDYSKEKPVDDKAFDIFLRQYAYDKSPLNAQVITTTDTGIRKVEKVTIDAAYNNERLIMYLFMPNDANPPYQPVIFFPGSGVILENKFTNNNCYPRVFDFIVKSHRVLVYPVFKGTFERRDSLKSDQPEETVFYKDHVIMWRKDIGRIIDYLETRDDILSDKVGYFGYSWGARLGGLFPAVEKRIKAVVLHVGGLKMKKSFPEVDPFNFLPRIYQPVLMLNGKYDVYFPVETSQKPMFNLLGTPKNDKNLIIYDAGHLVPRTDLIKETLAWYDKYLGAVK